jgi:hypothetical protein
MDSALTATSAGNHCKKSNILICALQCTGNRMASIRGFRETEQGNFVPDRPQVSMLGAVASSAGDDFHQLWGMRKVLALLNPNADVLEVKLEGFPVDEIHRELGTDGQIVDVTTKISNENSETSFHYEQLKYSPSNPGAAWTWARLLANKSKTKKGTSIFARLAGMLLEAPIGSTFSIVTNQPVDETVENDIKRLLEELKEDAELDDVLAQTLREVIGRTDGDLLRVLQAWDLLGFGAAPRLKLETEIIQRVGEFTDADARNDVDLLQQRIATLMLPEGMHYPPVTRETVLTWLGGGSSEVLFPAPSSVERAQPYLKRKRTDALVDLIATTGKPIRLSAPGGCGKTSLLAALQEELPAGSEVVIYDCYGGGLFMSSDNRRHLPQRALVQVSNEIAARLDIPVMLRRETSGPIASAFLRRLQIASEVLRQRSECARLVVVFDAADNSIIASEHWKEESFVREAINLSDLPDNVSLLFSCRDARAESLGPYVCFREFRLQAFDEEETQAFVALHHAAWVPAIANTLHELTGGTPRRLAYAVKGLKEEEAKVAIDRLMPKAVGIDPLFQKRLDEAGQRLGSVDKVKQSLAVLAFLPRPVPGWAIAELSGLVEADVSDIATDLGGIKERASGWSFHDEDFEYFAREQTSAFADELLGKAADLLLSRHSDDAYAARAVGEILMRTGRYTDLYNLVRAPSSAPSPLSGIEARLVQARRLTLAINCCKGADDLGAACSLLVAAANEMKSDRLVKKLTLDNLPLSCLFAPEQTMQLTFSTASKRRSSGPMRIHLAAACAAAQPLQAREHVRWWNAALTDWSQQEKNQRFSISNSEIVAKFMAFRELNGLQFAIDAFLRWRPFSNGQRPLSQILQHIAGDGPPQFLAALEYRNWPPIVKSQLMAAAILAGELPSSKALHEELSILARTSSKRWETLSTLHASERFEFAEAVLIVCEHMQTEPACHEAIIHILDTAFPKVEFKERWDISRFRRYADFYVRSFAIRENVTGTAVVIDAYLPEPKELPKPPVDDRRRRYSEHPREKSEEELWNETARDAAKILKRLAAASHAGNHADAMASALKRGYDEYGYGTSTQAIVRFVSAWLIRNALVQNSVEANLSTCLKILGDWQSSEPKNQIAIVVTLSRVPSARGVALELLPKIAKEVEKLAAPASDRSELMMSCAHAALPMDPELARDFYERAIRLTEKIDVEVMSQLELAAVIAEAGINGSRAERIELATRLADTASAADATLGMDDHFPWSAVVKGVAAADLPTGFAAVSQWRDFGTLHHHRSIPDFLSGCASETLAGEYKFALSIFAGRENMQLQDCFGEGQIIPTAAIDRHCRDALWTADRSVILGAHWENAIVHELPKTDGKQKLHQVAKKLLEWHPGSGNSATPETIGGPLQTDAEVIEALADLVENTDGVSSYGACLIARRLASPNLRTVFLRQAAELAGEESWFGEVLIQLLDEWQTYPPVAVWAREELPSYITASMPEHFEWRYSETDTLDALLRLTGLSSHDQALVIFEGIQHARRDLHAEMIYAFAGLVAVRSDAATRAALLREMLDRLNGRLDQQPKIRLAKSVAPDDVDLSIARTLYAAMADIDREVRWDSSHAVLILAQLNCSSVIGHLASLLGQETENAFAYQNAPFYKFAAQEQLLTTFCRAAVDNPELIASVHQPIQDITLSTSHLIVRELGKRLLLMLVDGGHLQRTKEQRDQLAALNESPFEPVSRPAPTYGRPRDGTKKKRKFEFDDTDTIPYWYSTPANLFNLRFDEFLDRVEAWVNGKWGFVDTDAYWLKEPRIERLRDQSGNSDHRHGTIPRIERLSRYIEWHGMMHAVGELVHEVPMFVKEGYDDLLSDWIEDHLPTLSPYWVSDFRTPPPLEPRFWGYDDSRLPDCESKEDDKDDHKIWSRLIPDAVFDEEVGLSGDGSNLVVASNFNLRRRDSWEDVQIRSALVTTQTADALGQALLTVRDHMDFLIPSAEHHLEIVNGSYVLRGWLHNEDREPKADRCDSRRGSVYGAPFEPSQKFVRELGLVFHPEASGWTIAGGADPALKFDFWGSDGEHVPGEGWRATASSELLEAMLQKNDMSMIVSVEIERSILGKRSYKRQWRIYIVDQDGTVRKVQRKKRSLGRYWVRKLNLDYSCNTVLRWKLHRLAELVEDRKAAETDERQVIEAQIGRLWLSLGEKNDWDKEWPDSPSITLALDTDTLPNEW